MSDKTKNVTTPIVFAVILMAWFWLCWVLVLHGGASHLLLAPFVMLLPCAVILVLAYWQKIPLRQLGITKKRPVITLVLLGGYIALFIINGDFSADGFFWAFYFLVLIGFGEEFIFRGYLFSSLDKEYGFAKAALISGVFFALVHYIRPLVEYGTIVFNPPGILLYIAIGAVFAFIFKKTGNIWIVSIIHGYVNYVSVIVLR